MISKNNVLVVGIVVILTMLALVNLGQGQQQANAVQGGPPGKVRFRVDIFVGDDIAAQRQTADVCASVSDGQHFCKNNVTVKDASQVTTKFTFDKAVDGSTVTGCVYFQGSRYCDTQDYFGESSINVIPIAEETQ